MKVQRLSSTDGFIVWDLDAATTSAGILRLAPKVLQDGAMLLARSVTYSFALFGLEQHGGASAGLNSKPEDRDASLAAFVDEVRPLAETGRLRLAPGLGANAEHLAPLGWEAPDAGLLEAGAIGAAQALGSLEGKTVAVVGSGPVAPAAGEKATAAGAELAEPRFDSQCDILFVAGKAGSLDHTTAASVKAQMVVPLTPVPVTARSLAILHRADTVVVPDFLSIAAPLLAEHDPEAGDPVERVRQTAEGLASEGTGMWMAAALAAEQNLRSWSKEKPFGRPLA